MKNFLKQNYDRHLIYSFIILFFALFRLDLKDAESWFVVFLGAFLACFINLAREMYYSKFHEAPFDYKDIFLGTIGGILAGIIHICL